MLQEYMKRKHVLHESYQGKQYTIFFQHGYVKFADDDGVETKWRKLDQTLKEAAFWNMVVKSLAEAKASEIARIRREGQKGKITAKDLYNYRPWRRYDFSLKFIEYHILLDDHGGIHSIYQSLDGGQTYSQILELPDEVSNNQEFQKLSEAESESAADWRNEDPYEWQNLDDDY